MRNCGYKSESCEHHKTNYYRRRLNASKAAGDYEIVTQILTEYSEYTSKTLTCMFKALPKTRVVPRDRKRANITHIHKKGPTDLLRYHNQLVLFHKHEILV